MRRWLEERPERSIHEGSHFGEGDRRLRPFGSVVSAVSWPEGSETPEEPLSEDVVSGGGVVSDGGVVSGGGVVVSPVESPVESLVGSLVGSLVEPSFVSVDVELSGGVKPLVSVVLYGGGVSVEFDRVVELVMSVQLKIEGMLERYVLFIRVGSWLAGIRQVVVVALMPDVGSVRLAVYAPEVSFEMVAGSIMVEL